MISLIEGKLELCEEKFVIVNVGGVGYRIFISSETASKLPRKGSFVKFWTQLYVREDTTELYGFLSKEELDFFELLNSVAGIGPKSALGIMNMAAIDDLKAAISEGKIELLTKASGIGRKTAERIVLELKDKIKKKETKETISRMESDLEVEVALLVLGYSKSQIKEAIKALPDEIKGVEARTKATLKILSKK